MFIGGKKMKKALPFLLCAALLAGCSNGTANNETEPETKEETTEETGEEVQTVGVYTIYNATGEGVTELYLYPTGAADKGENYAAGGHGFGDAHAKILQYDGSDNPEVELTLEFTTNSGYTGKFETLHIETAPISLIAEDAMTGSTQIAFAASSATYDIYNVTGEEVTDLYLYRTGSADKGENLIDGAKEDGGKQTISFDAVPEFLLDDSGNMGAFTIEFTTASGYTGKFETLSYENAPISLIAEDAMTGSTQIKFGAPQN
jgi:uncharacterized protein (DUF736 family)